jgi:hypothetical protein
MGRHDGAQHDPLCGTAMTYIGTNYVKGCRCDFIARVRADERARWSPPAPATPGHVDCCWCPKCLTGHDMEVQG